MPAGASNGAVPDGANAHAQASSLRIRHYDSRSVYAQDAAPGERIFLSGQQMLVRLLFTQAALDRANGLRTAGFVSGYRGSPLGGVDRELMKASGALEKSDIRFLPAINEDLAATALIGTQRVETDPNKRYDGVFGMWYGKGPGVDRSGDAIKHGNAYGSSAKGGVLVVTGDDHGCVSSSLSHQSDRTLIAWGLPVIHPNGLEDYERCGLWGWALSRASGLWVGFKAITETVEATTSVDASPLPEFVTPEVDPGPDGLHWRWPDLPGMQIERRMPFKFAAARAFALANPLDSAVTAPQRPKLVIGAVGKAYGDVRQALQQCGVTLQQLEDAGVALLKISLVYPLSPVLDEWATRADKVLIIEEKQAIVEEQLKHKHYNTVADRRAVIIGKTDEHGQPLVCDHEELRPSRIAAMLQHRLQDLGIAVQMPTYWLMPAVTRDHAWIRRTPYLCSGCPHNTSTLVPKGSEARLGIGCHAMAARMPERSTSGSVQMGGEGVDWIGQAPFVETPHIFQNIGDGTFFHSGFLAIRQAIAAGVTITYKLLYNDAVAMTGGQPIDGKLTVKKAVELVKAEGAQRIVVVADDLERYREQDCLPDGIELYHRDRLEDVQLQLRQTRGVSVLVFDQVCATEGRRRQKQLPAPAVKTQVVINEAVCEGCGDCQVKSNCLSVTPVQTPFGTKRRIDPHSCNTDLSCIKGFCPSFVTVTGKPRAQRRRVADSAQVLARAAALAAPLPSRSLDTPYEMLLVGIGGTGIVTVARTIALAAHLDGRAVSVLDFTGFAQKGGAVLSHIRLANEAQTLHQHRIDIGGADLLLAADLVVASEDDALATLRPEKTVVIANSAQTQTGAMLRSTELRIETQAIVDLLKQKVGADNYHSLDAGQLADTLVDPMQANMLMLGYAWQRGTVPVSQAALNKAIDLAGSAAANHLAFAWGRLLAQDAAFVAPYLDPSAAAEGARTIALHDISAAPNPRDSLVRLIERNSEYLTHYQNAAYAARYRRVVNIVRAAPGAGDGSALTEAVARNLFKLMAYKDEYEVARLLTTDRFLQSLASRFEGRTRLTFHFALPWLRDKQKKTEFSGWVLPLLKVLAKGRVLRHTRFDPLGWSAERREERRLIQDYEAMLLRLLPELTQENLAHFIAWANLPDSIRGYGHVKERSIAAARLREKALIEQILLGEHPVPIHREAAGVESWVPPAIHAAPSSNEAERDVMEAS